MNKLSIKARLIARVSVLLALLLLSAGSTIYRLSESSQ
jgi:hypothetical protein